MGFGAGVRSCVGMRLALLEAKIALIRMVKKFSFEAVPQTKHCPVISPTVVVVPEDGVIVKLGIRSK
jgi:cytochrome P450